jgi:hypothetical protein
MSSSSSVVRSVTRLVHISTHVYFKLVYVQHYTTCVKRERGIRVIQFQMTKQVLVCRAFCDEMSTTSSIAYVFSFSAFSKQAPQTASAAALFCTDPTIHRRNNYSESVSNAFCLLCAVV